MKKLKAMHPFEKALVASFLFLLFVTIASSLTGCGSVKKVEKAEVKTHEVLKSDSTATTTKDTETKIYGDTLQGEVYVSFLQSDSTLRRDTLHRTAFHASSTGLDLTGYFEPIVTNGKITGTKFNYTTTAKPTSKTNTHTVDNSTVNKTLKKDIKSKSQSNTTTKAGFSIPWYCWLILVALAALAGFLFLKRLKLF